MAEHRVDLGYDNSELAETYAAESQLQRELVEVVVQQLGDIRAKRVLDIGSGTGEGGELAADAVGPSGYVLGIEPLADRVEIARRKARANLEFKEGNALHLSELNLQNFDAAFSNAVWHWLDDEQDKAYRQARSVLAPGSPFVVSTGSSEHPFLLPQIKREILSQEPFKQYGVQGIAKFSTYKEVHTDLCGAGFTVQKIYPHVCVVEKPTARAMLEFWKSSGFGTLFGHLPEALQLLAEKKLVKEFEELKTEEGKIKMELVMWIAVAVAS